MKLSVCIITKNEKEKLERCLKMLAGYKEWLEIVVVDTGSTDGTKTMAAQYTSQIFDFLWQDDFSLARNYAALCASYDNILVLDSDEYLVEEDILKKDSAGEKRYDWNQMVSILERNKGKVGCITLVNLLEKDGEVQRIRERLSRLYNRKYFHYEGKIHEQLVPGATTANVGTFNNQDIIPERKLFATGITVIHDGYRLNPEEMKHKVERNIKLLQKELDNHPAEPYLLYQLGKSYYMEKEYDKAIEAFDQVLCQDINPELEYVIDMIQAYGYSLLNSGRVEQALSLEGIYDTFGKTADFRFLMGLIYMNNGLFAKAKEEFIRATEVDEAHTYTVGTNSYLAWYNAGVIAECTKDVSHAAEYYQACGEYAPAKNRLEQLLVTIK